MTQSGPRTTAVLIFVVPAVLALLLGMLAGLGRLPLSVPAAATIAALHGPLMVAGFLGTVIGLERAAALDRAWAWLAPAGNALGTAAMLLGLGMFAAGPTLPLRMGGAMFTCGGLAYLAVFTVILRLQPTVFNGIMTLGALAYAAAGVLLWLGRPVADLVHLWAAFLVLTILGERLELNRLLAPRAADRGILVLTLGLLVVGVGGGLAGLAQADLSWGAGLVLGAGWLLWRDLARRTVRLAALTRYIAVCLLTGYGWLLVSGILVMVFPGRVAGPTYDAVWHTLFVGFVLAMIFGHAPIILPALTGREVAFSRVFYAPLLLLHATLMLRVVGDLVPLLTLRNIGGAANVVAVLAFMVVVRRSLRT